MGQVFKKVQGTTSPEFYVGPGDADVAGQQSAGIRTTPTGEFQYKNAGGAWQTPSGSGGLTPETHQALDQLVHEISENHFEEYSYSGGKVTGSIVWTDSGKTLRIRDYAYTYSGSKVATETVQQYNALGVVVETLVFTYSYTGSLISSVDCVRT